MKLLTAQLEVKQPEEAADSPSVGTLAEQNYRRWRAVQEEIHRTLRDAARVPADCSIERPPPLDAPALSETAQGA
jgi:hypothetical protein